jgi:TonB family protein
VKTKQKAVRMRTALSAFALAAMVGGASAGQPPTSPRRTFIEAPVSVSANGTATIGKLEGIDGAVAQKVLRELGKLRFKPAIVDGAPVAAETALSAMLVLQPREGLTEMALDEVYAGPLWLNPEIPIFPIEMAQLERSGFAELRIAVAPDGSVEKLETVGASHTAFDRAARKVLRSARFKPVRVDGRAVATEVSIPFLFSWFRGKGNTPYLPQFACTLDSRRPSVEGQDGCLPLIEVWGARERSSLRRRP